MRLMKSHDKFISCLNTQTNILQISECNAEIIIITKYLLNIINGVKNELNTKKLYDHQKHDVMVTKFRICRGDVMNIYKTPSLTYISLMVPKRIALRFNNAANRSYKLSVKVCI